MKGVLRMKGYFVTENMFFVSKVNLISFDPRCLPFVKELIACASRPLCLWTYISEVYSAQAKYKNPSTSKKNFL